MHQWVHKTPFSTLLLFKGWSRISPYPEEGVRSKFVIASRNVCVGPGGPNITRTKNYLVLWKSNIALLKKRLSDMLKKEIFVQVQKVACSMKGEFAVSELLKCHPGDRDGILVSPTSKKCCFFGLTSSIFSLKKFRGKPIFECSYSWSTSWSNFSSVWYFFPPWPT